MISGWIVLKLHPPMASLTLEYRCLKSCRRMRPQRSFKTKILKQSNQKSGENFMKIGQPWFSASIRPRPNRNFQGISKLHKNMFVYKVVLE